MTAFIEVLWLQRIPVDGRTVEAEEGFVKYDVPVVVDNLAVATECG